jgi:hypothetical protein
MRTVDEPERFRGLGERVVKPAPAPAPAPKPQGSSGIVEEGGRMRTTTHIPRLTPLEEAIWNWREHYASDMSLDFLP